MEKSGENGSESMSAESSTTAGTYVEAIAKKPSTNLIKCDICSCEMSSDQVMTSHVNGSRHKKRLKALEIVAKMKATGEKGIELGPKDNPNTYRCEICSLSVNSPQQLEIHLAGAKHKSKIAKDKFVNVTNTLSSSKNQVQDNVSNATGDGPPAKKRKKEDKSLSCGVCNVVLNSETQYGQHILSKRHLNKLKGENQDRTAGSKGEKKKNVTQNMPPDNRHQGWKELDRPLVHKEPFRQRNAYNQMNSKQIPVNLSHNRFATSYSQMTNEDYNNGPYSNYFRNYTHH